MITKIKKIYVAIILLILSFSLSSCGKAKQEEKEGSKEIKSIEIKAGNPIKKTMIEIIRLNGTTSFQRQEIVRATFQGFIEKSCKTIGDKIKKGDLLFVIKTKEAAAVDSIYSKLNKNDFEGFVKIYAKTDGSLAELNHQTGDYVVDGDPLAVIVDSKSVQIAMNVPYQYAHLINLSSVYSVQLPDKIIIEAKVIKKIPSMDQANQIQSFILMPNSTAELPSNLNVIVIIPVKNVPGAVVLPKSAIMANETQTDFWVMKLLNDTTAVKIEIVKGIEDDSLVQISEPRFNLEDRVIFEGAFGLPDTASILIKK